MEVAVDVMRLTGRVSLRGEVSVVGAKNSALKLMTAALLAPGRTEVTNVPRITDIMIMAEVLRRLGCEIRGEGDTVTVDTPEELSSCADYDLVRRLRASINVLGPLVARQGYAKVAHPGGDAIGSRGLDMHVSGLARMGAEVSSEHGYVIARADRLRGAAIWLDFPSVGTTENLMMAAALAKGTTVIDNAAREPEVADTCAMLNDMGARIAGAGTSTLIIEGVDELRPVRHRAIGDRIIGGTWAYGAAMTRGDITVRGVSPDHLPVALEKLAAAGALVDVVDGGFRVRMIDRPRGVDVVTLPYPGLATDLLPMAIGLAAVSDGVSLVTENVFDGRFMFINEMCRLGADIRTDGHHAVVRGREALSSAPVRATDIRAGAGLVLAALCADGMTEVSAVHHIDRGYPDFAAELRSLGAEVERLTVPEEPDPYRSFG
ncbi:MAG TPA: UDP-N-acetylglucosamine 1-carboxyvinyltransferase [Micromonosporaceae bacterium]|jgi:UDP-N-acetylglucosamine 1-carboxyvinyltransferase|nr:UDP-N-acetylglucosamine 1-carboxyvinyltransferase [Micromonosporaceae bacterium]